VFAIHASGSRRRTRCRFASSSATRRPGSTERWMFRSKSSKLRSCEAAMMMHVVLAVLAALQAAPAVDPMRAAVEQLTTTASNEERFEAVTALLRARKIPFAVERFTIEKPIGREPRTEGRNIVATFGSGANPIVVGAHYDATRLQDGTLSHGATDNAGSSVILATIAESLLAQPPAGRVTLVWFDMEELGLIGSQKYIEAHAGERIGAML